MKNKKEKVIVAKKTENNNPTMESTQKFPQGFVSNLASEVAKTLARMPGFKGGPRRKSNPKKKKIDNPIFLDTSAIIDG